LNVEVLKLSKIKQASHAEIVEIFLLKLTKKSLKD